VVIYLYEGVDRAGKSTKVREHMARRRERPTVALHFQAPPKGQSRLVLAEMARVFDLQHANPDMDFVLDRGHASWAVYEHLYRDHELDPATFMQDWEARRPDVECQLIHVGGDLDTATILARDDGDSTWSKGQPDVAAALEKERELFAQTCEASRFNMRWVFL